MSDGMTDAERYQVAVGFMLIGGLLFLALRELALWLTDRIMGKRHWEGEQ
jgi:hypothetical protein